MDKLAVLLRYFTVSAGVFYSGGLCGLIPFGDDDGNAGHLHLVRAGRLTVSAGGFQTVVSAPGVLFFPRRTRHQLHADEADQAEIVCATVRYGTLAVNPLANGLPPVMAMNLHQTPRLWQTADWLFEEAFGVADGRQAVMDRLAELFLIQVLRHVIETGESAVGPLAGLAHPKLASPLLAMYADPARNWRLDELAVLGGMSRTGFANEFKRVVGQSMWEYLSDWRVSIAQTLLQQGKAVGWVAHQVGYETASAMARVFRKRTGKNPTAWLLEAETANPGNAP